MRVPDELKDKIAQLINEHMYERPTAHDIWEQLDIPHEVDGNVVFQYISTELKSYSFQSDERLSVFDVLIIEEAINEYIENRSKLKESRDIQGKIYVEQNY